MHNYIILKFSWQKKDFEVETERTCVRATSPSCFLVADSNRLIRKTVSCIKVRKPRVHKRTRGFFMLCVVFFCKTNDRCLLRIFLLHMCNRAPDPLAFVGYKRLSCADTNASWYRYVDTTIRVYSNAQVLRSWACVVINTGTFVLSFHVKTIPS